MLKKIGVLLYEGQGTINRVKVWAWVVGNLAIHRPVAHMAGITYQKRMGWTITHVPSGGVVASETFREDAIRRFNFFLNYRFHGRAVLQESPVCELVNLSPLIQQDLGKSEQVINNWVTYFRADIEQANGCEKAKVRA